MEAAYHREPNPPSAANRVAHSCGTFLPRDLCSHLISKEQILKHSAWRFCFRTYRSYSLNADAIQLLPIPSINICFDPALRLALDSSVNLFDQLHVMPGSHIGMRLSRKMSKASGDPAPFWQMSIYPTCFEGRSGQTTLKKWK